MAERWEDWFEPGERLLWEGGPARGVHHPFRNAFMTAFGIPFLFGGLMVFGTGVAMGLSFASVWSIFGAIGLMAFSAPFLGVGTGMVVGPWFHDLQKHARVRYALSDRAGYVASRWWRRQMNVMPLTSGTRVEFDGGRGDTGSIWFSFETTIDGDGDKSTKKQGFESVSDARAVYNMVRDAVAALTKDRT